MQGTIFVEFISMIESMFGLDVVDEIIDSAKQNLKTGGAYTSIGNYDHEEIFSLVTALVEYTGKDANELIGVFGKYLSGSFKRLHPEFFVNVNSYQEFLESVGTYIHVSVKKIYPDANPPDIHVEILKPNSLTLSYSSRRPFASLAKELVISCADHFDTTVSVETLNMSEDFKQAKFKIDIQS